MTTLYPKLITDALATVIYPGTKKNPGALIFQRFRVVAQIGLEPMTLRV